MNDTERTTVFQELAAMLRQAGLGWVVDHVELEVAYGRQGEKLLSAGGVQTFIETVRNVDASEPPRISRKVALAVEPYDELGRLRLLIEAVKRAAADSAAVESELAGKAREQELRPLVFVSELASGEFEVPAHGAALRRTEAVTRLESLLNELKELAEA